MGSVWRALQMFIHTLEDRSLQAGSDHKKSLNAWYHARDVTCLRHRTIKPKVSIVPKTTISPSTPIPVAVGMLLQIVPQVSRFFFLVVLPLPHLKAVFKKLTIYSSEHPSAQIHISQPNTVVRNLSNNFAPSRSCKSEVVTFRARMLPFRSTKIGRVLPVIFLPASSPWTPG